MSYSTFTLSFISNHALNIWKYVMGIVGLNIPTRVTASTTRVTVSTTSLPKKWNQYHGIKEILSKKSYQRNPIKEILSKKSYQRNPIKEILSKKSYQRNPIKKSYQKILSKKSYQICYNKLRALIIWVIVMTHCVAWVHICCGLICCFLICCYVLGVGSTIHFWSAQIFDKQKYIIHVVSCYLIHVVDCCYLSNML